MSRKQAQIRILDALWMMNWTRLNMGLFTGRALAALLGLCCLATAVEGAPTGAVLGLDLGSDNSVVAIARRKGVDIVTNEASHRSTPSLVSVSQCRGRDWPDDLDIDAVCTFNASFS